MRLPDEGSANHGKADMFQKGSSSAVSGLGRTTTRGFFRVLEVPFASLQPAPCSRACIMLQLYDGSTSSHMHETPRPWRERE